MPMALLLIFIAVPLLEIALLIKLGELIHFWPTLAIVIGTAIVGTSIMRRQGLKALMNAQNSMERGQLPMESVVDGAFILLAGAFLLTPGLLTDSVGFLFLVPPVRRWLARWGFNKFVKAGGVAPGSGQATGFEEQFKPEGGDPRSASSAGDGDGTGHTARGSAGRRSGIDKGQVIDAEFERLDEKPVDPRRRR